MKCLVLAGGSSDRLWPLSRRDYPKQFMEIREGRSMFQDTILRNIPFCDEFFILTNKKYENVVRSQLTAFQDLSYRIILEEVMIKTAPAVAICLQNFDMDEEVLIVPTDGIISGDYYSSITILKESVKRNEFAVLVCNPKNLNKTYNYIMQGKKIMFGTKPSRSALWDTGIWGAKVHVFLKALDKKLLDQCANINFRKSVLEKGDTEKIDKISLINCMHPQNCKLISITFDWIRITDISSLYNYQLTVAKKSNNVILNNCNNIEIVNSVDEQLVAVNGLKNVVIVNTRDAVYVTNNTNEADIKKVLMKFGNSKKTYFDLSPIIYESWGTEELVGSSNECRIKAISVYAYKNFEYQLKKNTNVNFFIVQGEATLLYDDVEQKFACYQNIVLSDSRNYLLRNNGKNTLIMIVVEKMHRAVKSKNIIANNLVKLQPVFKDNLWGGTKIKDYLGKEVGDMDIIAESWELSAHDAGESKIANGEFIGKTLSEYIDIIGKEKLGWKAQNYNRFPLMVKFIDARDNLSVQVHPDDEYAMSVENEFGKNEMWYILDADDDSYIYNGFCKDVTADEIRERIDNNSLVEILNKIYVKKGEVYFLKAGTVHAIGAGCFICEIQQSSNLTYRLYDYGRRDKFGNLRELHIEKAINVLNMKASTPKAIEEYETVIQKDYVKRLIGQCKYFTVNQYYIDGKCILPASESSFQVFIIIYGNGTISDGVHTYTTKLGDTWFCTNKQQITLSGKFKVLKVNI